MINPQQPIRPSPGIGSGLQKTPVGPMNLSTPVPSRPSSVADYMNQLQKPMAGGSAYQEMQNLRNKLLPRNMVKPMDLSSSIPAQIQARQKVMGKNQEIDSANRKINSEMASQGIRYTQALMQQELAERSLYTRFAVDTLQRSADRVQEIKNMKIDPARYFKDMSSWQRIVGFIGIAAAGIMHARAGYDPNEVLIGINNIIEQDVEAQTRDLEGAKFEHQQLNLLDSQRLKIMGEHIDARDKTRANAAALVMAELAEMKSYESDQRKIASYDEISKDIAKTYIKHSIAAQFQKRALAEQIDKNSSAAIAMENFENSRERKAKANPNIRYSRITQSPPGDYENSIEGQTEASGGIVPDKTPDGQYNLTPEDKREFEHSYDLKKMARNMEYMNPAQRILASMNKDWQHKQADVDAYNRRFKIKTLSGATVYPSEELLADNPKLANDLQAKHQELIGDKSLLMQALKVTSHIGGLDNYLNSKYGDQIQSEGFSSPAEAANNYRQKLKDAGAFDRDVLELSADQRKEIFDKFTIPKNKKAGDARFTKGIKEAYALTGLTTEENDEIAGPVNKTLTQIRMLAARAISIVTGEESARKSDKELAFTFLAILGSKEIDAKFASEYDFKQRFQILSHVAAQFANSAVDELNNTLDAYVDGGGNQGGLPAGAQKFAAQYHLNKPSLYQNNHWINIADQLRKTRGVEFWDSSPFGQARKKYLDGLMGYVQLNEGHLKQAAQGPLNPDTGYR